MPRTSSRRGIRDAHATAASSARPALIGRVDRRRSVDRRPHHGLGGCPATGGGVHQGRVPQPRQLTREDAGLSRRPGVLDERSVHRPQRRLLPAIREGGRAHRNPLGGAVPLPHERRLRRSPAAGGPDPPGGRGGRARASRGQRGLSGDDRRPSGMGEHERPDARGRRRDRPHRLRAVLGRRTHPRDAELLQLRHRRTRFPPAGILDPRRQVADPAGGARAARRTRHRHVRPRPGHRRSVPRELAVLPPASDRPREPDEPQPAAGERRLDRGRRSAEPARLGVTCHDLRP
jgi:hypothetical protein